MLDRLYWTSVVLVVVAIALAVASIHTLATIVYLAAWTCLTACAGPWLLSELRLAYELERHRLA